MRTYTVSVVGAGMGGGLSMAGAHASSRFELAAVADLSEDALASAAEKWPGLRTFTSHREMFAQCPTDVVCVSTWPPSHRTVTLDALEALPLTGIVVEKPLGDTVAAGRDIIEAVKAAGLPMATPHNLLVSPHALQIIERVRAGEIGELVLVEVEGSQWDMFNAGIHWANFFVVLTALEPIESVLAACDTSTRTHRDGMQVETVAVTHVLNRSGRRCILHTGNHVPTMREGKSTLFRVIGTKGLIEFWAWEPAYRIVSEKYPGGDLVEVAADGPGGHQAHLENLAAQMAAGEADYTVPESSLTALEICEAAYLSSRHRCCVTFPLASFEPPALTDWDPGRPYSGTGGGRDGRRL